MTTPEGTTSSDASALPRLPRLAVGCMNFGKRTTADESIRIVARALERGLVWFDTANVYNEGDSETILGRALGADRSKCFVATKVGLARTTGKPEGLRPERILAAIDESLARLGTTYVDLYYLHAPDRATPFTETLDAIGEVLKSGKARAWGMSNYASWQVLDAMNLADARAIARPAVAQLLYNAMIRQLEIEWFAFAKAHPIHTTIYNPLAGGLLTDRQAATTGKDAPTPGSRFDGNGMYMRRYWSDAMLELARALGDVAKEEGLPLVDFAYAWVAGRGGVDSILLGPASVSQLDAGIDGCARALSAGARKKADELFRAFQGTDATYAR